MTQLSWTGKAAKDLRKIPSKDQQAVREKINTLLYYPNIGNLDFRKLTDRDNQYRLRVGSYRVLIEVQNGEPVVMEIQRILRRSSTTY
ncbi:type II toxin-antitoxin system RelE/ParE family toxin [Erwiniaceae bacterium BAC15a-03b]|uniref:Type II toxin-antitoxin system RelE/ParE family toxin n=1 Tax=Winslowiella arboricola TaxID=2978220 RepID=A0A9J6PI47_9GAMM|nr:type II toxin-antitoxin system RelE/ParE family toxin [Winslowiella arboricola]MCU5771335.1 type II toxin-antitoxin system RelE/ParE family toxin [Winslowiella arboricola]MCU5777034.1 type II toxin-antitoxin system RelE/ParE family toxin [Winslowiella arboricola]